MTDSILNSVKEQLGLPIGYAPYDKELITYTNTALAEATQLGVGPEEGFSISDAIPTWNNFMGTDKRFNLVQTYIFLTVRIVFDPPPNSFGLESIQKQIDRLAWRINAHHEIITVPEEPVPPDDEDPDVYGMGPYGGGPYGI